MALFDNIKSVGDFLKDKFSGKNIFEQEDKKNPFVSKYVPDKPKQDNVKKIKDTFKLVKDTAKELPEQFSRQVGQPSIRASFGLGNWISNRLSLNQGPIGLPLQIDLKKKPGKEYASEGPFQPQGQFQKDLLGTDKPITLGGIGRETRGGLLEGESRGAFKKIDPAVGFIIGGLDLLPGGSALSKELKAGVKTLKNLDKTEDVVSFLSKLKVGVGVDTAEEIAKTKSVSKITKLLESDLMKQTKVAEEATKSREALKQEAQQYATPEEFVRTQGEQVFRGGDKAFDKTLIGEDGVFVSPSKFMAETFGKNVDELRISPKAKVLSYNELPDSIKSIDNWDEYSKAVSKYGKEKGIDVIDSLPPKADFPRGMERTIINPDIIKTKSELEQIWKEAKSPTIINKTSGEEFKILDAKPDQAKVQSLKTGETLTVKSQDLNAKFEPTSQPPQVPPTGVQKTLESQLPVDFKERSLPKGAADAGTLQPEVQKKMTDFNYNVLHNKDLLAKAEEDVAQNADTMREWFLTTEPVSGDAAYSNAVGIKLIEQYDNLAIAAIDQKAKDEIYQKSADIWDTLARRATNSGQSVQILSNVSRQNPAVRRHFINKTVQNINDILEPGMEKVRLNDEDWKIISKYFAEADAAKTDFMKAAHTQKATNYVIEKFGDKIPKIVRILSKAKKYRYMAMLLNPKTWIRNILGNKTFAQMERVNNLFASPVDKLLETKTGKRAVSILDWNIYKKAAKEGAEQARQEVAMGVDTARDKFKYDYPTIKFNSKIMRALDRMTQKSLRVPDRAAFNGTFESEVASLMKANKLSEPTEEIIDIATEAAEMRTFQDDSFMANIFEKMRKNVNQVTNKKLLETIGVNERASNVYADQMIGVGDLIVPFVRTPFNLLSRGLSYTPLGFARGMAYLKKTYSLVNKLKEIKKSQPGNERAIRVIEKELSRVQRNASTALSRGVLGTGAFVMPGYFLAKKGIITDKYSQEEASAEGAKRKIGSGPTRINISALGRLISGGGEEKDFQRQPGDVMISYDWLMPASIPMSIGVALSKMEDGGLLNKLLEVPTAAFGTIEDQPMLQALKKLSGESYGEGFGQGILDVFSDVPASFTPTFFNQIRQVLDTKKRQTKDESYFKEAFINKIVNRIPILSKSLTPQVDAFGNIDRTLYNADKHNVLVNAFNAVVNPAFISTISKDDKEAKFMLELFEETGKQDQFPEYLMNKTSIDIKVNGEKVKRKVTPEEKAMMQTYIGATTRALTYEAMQDKQFQKLEPEDQVEILKEISNDAYNSALSIFLEKDLSKQTSKRVRGLVGEYQRLKKQNKSYLEYLDKKFDGFKP